MHYPKKSALLILSLAMFGLLAISQPCNNPAYASVVSSTNNVFHIGFDKTLYAPGNTVVIHADSVNSSVAYKLVTLKILDATTDLEGTHVFYESDKTLSNGTATFDYTIPSSVNQQTTYRYLVQVYQDQKDCCPLGSAYFVTLPDANNLSIAHVKVLTPVVIPGQAINITALIRDGIGTPVRNLDVKMDLPQSDEGSPISGNATLDSSNGLYFGTIPIPKNLETNLPVQYYVRTTAQGPAGMTFLPAEFRGGIVNIASAPVPEFPVAVPMLAIGFLSIIMLGRKIKIGELWTQT